MNEGIFNITEINEVCIVNISEQKLYEDIVSEFRDKIICLLDEGKNSIIINFENVEVINSSGLGVLIMIWDRLKKNDGNFVITGLNSFLYELFERMRLNLIFRIEADVETALTSLS